MKSRQQSEAIITLAHNHLLETIQHGLIVIDEGHHVVDINSAARQILVPAHNDVLGLPVTALFRAWPAASQWIAAELEGTFPLCVTQNDVTTRYQLEKTVLRNAQQAPRGFLLTLHREPALAHSAAPNADAAIRARRSFLHAMSHEIRTPVGAVVGMGNLLRDTPLNAEQSELVNEIIENSDFLLTTINNILEFSRLEAGDLPLSPHPFDLRATIRQVVDKFTPQARSQGLDLAYAVADDVPNVFHGDTVRLRQILDNLLSNALKFTDAGTVSLSIKGQATAAGYQLKFAVQDTGIGLSEGDLPHLFMPLTQIDGSSTRRHGGLGLGLAISKRLCEQMGGQMWVESEKSTGSTFFFTIVVEQTEADPVYVQNESSILRDKCLLIAAENVDYRRLVSREAQVVGMVPYVAGSAPEALYWLKREQIDLILIDARLLGKKTADLIAKVHALPVAPPIILLADETTPTAVREQVDRRAILQHPVVTSKLYDVLVQALTVTTQADTSPVPQPEEETRMADRHPLRVLVVEDNPVNQKVLQRLLHRLGYQPDLAASGLEGVTAVQQQSYDVVLMDIQMPGMDGVTATRRIRTMEQLSPQPKIIAVTAHAMAGDRENYLAAGMDDYLSKPIQLETLVEVLYRCGSANGRSASSPSITNDVPSQATPPARSDPIDLTALEAMIGSDVEEFLAEMAPLFIEDAAPLLTEMQQAAAQDDAETLYRAAHTLKGASASLGMTTLADLCLEVEQLSKSNSLDEIDDKLSVVTEEYEHIVIVLTREYL